MFFETDASEESVIRKERQANRASFKRPNFGELFALLQYA